MRTELASPALDCSSAEELQVLSRQLEVMETGIDLYNSVAFNEDQLGLDDEGERAGRCETWQRSVQLPCASDSTQCDMDVVQNIKDTLRLRCY